MSLRTIVGEMGARDGALYAASRLLQKLSGGRAGITKYYFFAQPIGRPGSKPMRPDAATELKDIGPHDALRSVFPRPPAVISRRYASGATCTAALVRGEFAGFIWIQRDFYDEDELRCRYLLADPSCSVWDYDVYVEPKYRVGRTMARLWSHVDTGLAATGVRWSFSRISAFNPASLSSHARLGTVRCGSALFLRLGPLQVSWAPPFPWLHVSVRDAQAPTVRLTPPA